MKPLLPLITALGLLAACEPTQLRRPPKLADKNEYKVTTEVILEAPPLDTATPPPPPPRP
jgi:hypothetical protein